MMDKTTLMKNIHDQKLIAVIRGKTPDQTILLVDALVAGGVKTIEITFTTPDPIWIVQELKKKYQGDLLLGMGTLTDPGQAEQAAQAGAEFLVSPHYQESLCRSMKATGCLVMVGALTPTEIFRAYHEGQADIIKIFPGSLVGPSYLKAIHGPYPELPLMPTGGVDLNNLREWLAAGAIAVGAGGSLAPKKYQADQDYDKIRDLAAAFIEQINQFHQDQ
jgi:2-dehydro-3-deoxyphosphogluconate aldolase/(4S)-4-hydroxy-2-oxoglutarate aldolase